MIYTFEIPMTYHVNVEARSEKEAYEKLADLDQSCLEDAMNEAAGFAGWPVDDAEIVDVT